MKQNNNPTIQAAVNTRLLGKAHRLFTGTLKGRITEVLQNARRAGATEVSITNHGGRVTVRDNGRGIEDFAKLLNLGGSGWLPQEIGDIEASEDPAGVGLFCLAPRKLVVRSLMSEAVIKESGWHGEPVEVKPLDHKLAGTELVFEDEAWDYSTVGPLAVFTGMDVIVDGKACGRRAFIKGGARHVPELGVRIWVVPAEQVPGLGIRCSARYWGCEHVYVNFHGQVVELDYQPLLHHRFAYLVEMTGEPTGLRLMLPARTCLIENDALKKLKEVIELEAYAYLKRQGKHKLPFAQYLRARQLGVNLPEAEPVYQVGLLSGGDIDPVEVKMPEGFSLSRCYRIDPVLEEDDSCVANMHLLGAFDQSDEPFVPVWINPCYDGYAWADLPRIIRVDVRLGATHYESELWNERVACVARLRIEAEAEDGVRFSREVPMALRPQGTNAGGKVDDDALLYLTPGARGLKDHAIWFHVGGPSHDGDSWDTQEYGFSNDLHEFWDRLVGPDETLRRELFQATYGIQQGWRSLVIRRDGTVVIKLSNGGTITMSPTPECMKTVDAPEDQAA